MFIIINLYIFYLKLCKSEEGGRRRPCKRYRDDLVALTRNAGSLQKTKKFRMRPFPRSGRNILKKSQTG